MVLIHSGEKPQSQTSIVLMSLEKEVILAEKKNRKKVKFVYNLFSKSEPFQCSGTVGKYPVFIFGIFQIVGGACQAGIMKTLDMQEGRNVRFYQKI